MKKASTKKEIILILTKDNKEVSLVWTEDWQNASDESIAKIIRVQTNILKKGLSKLEKIL